MGRKKELFLVIDTETANSIEQPLCYDIGYAICDRDGKIYLERSFIVAEMFLDHQDLMQSAYYHEKIPKYWDDIRAGIRQVKSIWNIYRQVRADIKAYAIRKVCAYNMDFDKRALNNTIRYCTQSRRRWFFPFGINYVCIWHMACQLVLSQATYIKFAIKNGLESANGNIQTSAESCYKFLKQQVDFVESHTGLEDVRIEIEIMAKCYAQHKKFDPSINRNCWNIPQIKRKEIEGRKKPLAQEEI